MGKTGNTSHSQIKWLNNPHNEKERENFCIERINSVMFQRKTLYVPCEQGGFWNALHGKPGRESLPALQSQCFSHFVSCQHELIQDIFSTHKADQAHPPASLQASAASLHQCQHTQLPSLLPPPRAPPLLPASPRGTRMGTQTGICPVTISRKTQSFGLIPTLLLTSEGKAYAATSSARLSCLSPAGVRPTANLT